MAEVLSGGNLTNTYQTTHGQSRLSFTAIVYEKSNTFEIHRSLKDTDVLHINGQLCVTITYVLYGLGHTGGQCRVGLVGRARRETARPI